MDAVTDAEKAVKKSNCDYATIEHLAPNVYVYEKNICPTHEPEPAKQNVFKVHASAVEIAQL